MKEQKVRFTVWLNPAVLSAAKARANRDGVSVSEVLSRAARREFGQGPDGDADAQVQKAVDRVFYLIQRTEKRRGFEHQILKEMLGLAVLSFFNHTPPVPDTERKAAHASGNIRFQQFLDAVAANLRRGRSVLAELPDPNADSQPAGGETNDASKGHSDTNLAEEDLKPSAPEQSPPGPSEPRPEGVEAPLHEHTPPPPKPQDPPKRWSLFGSKG